MVKCKKMSRERFLWFESGLHCGAHNLRLDRQQLSYTSASGTSVLRFYSSRPTASLGAHEFEAQSLRLGYCRQTRVARVRRLSGGSALYLDPGQIGWTLTVSGPAPDFAGAFRSCGTALCEALQRFGYPAEFREPNDLVLEGRKLGSLFLGSDETGWILQGSLIDALDIENMLGVLRVPKEKLNAQGLLTASGHFATLSLQTRSLKRVSLQGAIAETMSQAIGFARPEWVASLPDTKILRGREKARRASKLQYEAFIKTDGGVLAGALRLDARGRVRAVHLGGNVHVWPQHLFRSLETALRGTSEQSFSDKALSVIDANRGRFFGFESDDVLRLLFRLFERRRQVRQFDLPDGQVNTIMVHDPKGWQEALDILEKTQALLVPYCAKPAWCKWRHRDGCSRCGLCAVGDVYEAARQRGLPITTIRNFEHLQRTLTEFRETGVSAYLGMCCSNFFIKREKAFRQAEIPAVLLDISGSNCYELGQEQLAYAGEFTAEATLNEPVVASLVRFLPTALAKTS